MRLEKTKLFLLLGTFSFLSLGLTSCKFVEKAPEKAEIEREEVDFGDLDIDPDDDDHMEVVKKDKKKKEKDPSPPKNKNRLKSMEDRRKAEEEAEKKKKEKLKDNQQMHDDIIFNIVEKEVYVKQDAKLYGNAKLSGLAATGVSKGSKLFLTGLSEDKTTAMVQLSAGTTYFCDKDYLSDKYVSYNEEKESEEDDDKVTFPVRERVDPKPSNPSPQEPTNPSPRPEPQPAPTPTPAPEPAPTPTPSPEPAPEPQPTPEPEPTPEPVPVVPEETEPETFGGIPYPNNPSSTTVNYGVVFADEEFSATLINNAALSSGPGTISGSTGYYEIDYFTEGMTVYCTGIGSNGYIRVALANGEIGFIYNTDLIRN